MCHVRSPLLQSPHRDLGEQKFIHNSIWPGICLHLNIFEFDPFLVSTERENDANVMSVAPCHVRSPTYIIIIKQLNSHKISCKVGVILFLALNRVDCLNVTWSIPI